MKKAVVLAGLLQPYLTSTDGLKFQPLSEISQGASLDAPLGSRPGTVVELYFSDRSPACDYREGRYHLILPKKRLWSVLEALYALRLELQIDYDDPTTARLVEQPV